MQTNLDQVTLLRYAHIFRDRTSGGVEQYLRQLNYGLLDRNRMTILQMCWAPDRASGLFPRLEIEEYGLGRIVWVPIELHSCERSTGSLLKRLALLRDGKSLLGKAETHSLISVVRKAIANSCGHMRYSSMMMSESLVELFDSYRVDLATFHRLTYDVESLISSLSTRKIPFGIINHFNNSQLSTPKARRLMSKAAAVGSVSSTNAPADFQDDFVVLSDAVDTEFFSLARAEPVPRPDGLLVMLAGRLIAGKGHFDMLAVLKRAVDSGMNMSLAFAGVAETQSLVEELKSRISQWSLEERVWFLGELSREQLRDWYAASDVVVLPSSSEGLPRVLLEAQAMEKPIIAYDVGGVPDAILPDITGFLVQSGNHAAIEKKLRLLSDTPQMPHAMGRRGRAFVLENFSKLALVERHERFYARILSGRTC